MVEQGLSQQPDRDAFRLVGAGYRSHVSQGRDLSWRARIKGMPLFSMAILLLIVLGCVFAPLLANHDPTDFTCPTSIDRQDRNFVLARIRWGGIFTR